MSENTLEVTQYCFQDLVDVQAFSKMLEDFYRATHVANGIVGNDGELIAKAGWTRACVNFHRGQVESNQLCVDSNIDLIGSMKMGHSCGKMCANGVLDYATPVTIEGHQIATLFLGQVFHEAPDLAFFRAQAQRFGYDEEEYIKAIQAVPIVSKSYIDTLMTCLSDMAGMLVESGLTRLHQQRLERDLNAHREREIQLEDILDFSPVAIGWSNDKTGEVEYINRAFERLFGYSKGDIPDVETWYEKAYPDAEYRRNVIVPWYQDTRQSRHVQTLHPSTLDVNVTCKDGTLRHVHLGITWVGHRRLVSFSDMTDHWLAERRLHVHGKMLEMVAKGVLLTDILHAIVLQVEDEDPGSLCSVLLMTEDSKHLTTGCAPSIPSFYTQAVDGIEIGPKVGSCGTAAYTGKRIIVEDISRHEYWAGGPATLAAKAGLAACWSDPIISSSGQVLGTFAIYHAYPAKPSEKDIELISFASNLASIAIENRHAHEELERRAYYDYLTGLPNRRYFFELAEQELDHARQHSAPLSIVMMDVDHFKVINDRYGHKVGDRVLEELARSSLEILGEGDCIGRIGGEEFAILLPGIGQDAAYKIAQALRSTLGATKLHTSDGQEVRFTVSLGVSECHNNCSAFGIDGLLSRADKALYQAKNQGRNCVKLSMP